LFQRRTEGQSYPVVRGEGGRGLASWLAALLRTVEGWSSIGEVLTMMVRASASSASTLEAGGSGVDGGGGT
jgi:hypothetical protein